MKDMPLYDVYGDGQSAENLRRLRQAIIDLEDDNE